ncbi:Fic family protein [Candidatus Peregrinibacteria bacterium]|nr:Fic family protein [Candidatus Peregrinibacteria bacterium]
MILNSEFKNRVKELHQLYIKLKPDKDTLLNMLEEAEIAEGVYNSNAIENSTLSLQETEKILLELEVSRNVSLREVFEAKNLARVMEYIRNKGREFKLSNENIVLLHNMLLMNISENIAGRYREKEEYVRVGSHIAADPRQIPKLIDELLSDYENSLEEYFLEKIAKFHLGFEHIHPFNDGNGRIGRVLINYQFLELKLPPIILRNKEKREYYDALKQFDQKKDHKLMTRLLGLALMESLHKRIAYLQGKKLVPLIEFAKRLEKSPQAILNAAKRQTISAFRERGVWKIGV